MSVHTITVKSPGVPGILDFATGVFTPHPPRIVLGVPYVPYVYAKYEARSDWHTYKFYDEAEGLMLYIIVRVVNAMTWPSPKQRTPLQEFVRAYAREDESFRDAVLGAFALGGLPACVPLVLSVLE